MARRTLNKRQQARIGALQRKRKGDLSDDANDNATDQPAAEVSYRGRVIVRHGKQALVRDNDAQLVLCQMRQHIGQVVCGDLVIWQATDTGQGIISSIEPRQSALARPDYSGQNKAIAANISQLLCVLAPEPAPSGYLIDQYLITAELLGLHALLILNKCDLLDASDAAQTLEAQLAYYASIGYPVLRLSTKTGEGVAALTHRLANNLSILVGQSGVGKSSLVNQVLPDQDVQTGEISAATGHGRHTTSTTTLYTLPSGGELIDSPGVRSFRLTVTSCAELERGFREFADYLGQCHFSNCSHLHEPDCALIAAAESGKIAAWRFAHFQQMVKVLENRQR